MSYLLEILDQLKVLFFGSISAWENYQIGTTTVEGQTTTNWVDFLTKYSPHIVMLLLIFGLLLLIFYIIVRLIKKVI